MSAEMATKVQSKMYFPGTMMDLNKGLWDPYHDNRTERNPYYDPYLVRQTVDGYPGYPNPKEQIRQTILKQESVFRNQLQELHRVYIRQRDLMNEFTTHNQRRVIDLELPADVEDDNEWNKKSVENVHTLNTNRAYNLADLNEPIEVDETSFINKNYDKSQDLSANLNSGVWFLQTEPKKKFEQLSRKRRIFGVELCESSNTPSFDSSQSFSSKQIPDNFANFNNSRFLTNGINSKIQDAVDDKKNHEKQLPHWLIKTKENETKLYQMNLESLQQQSQQFFKKVETDNRHEITKILGVPIIDSPDKSKDSVKEKRNHIDLNLSFDEEDDDDPSSTPLIPESVIKIDLEAPATIETETNDVFINEHDEVVKNAAEAIMVILTRDPPTDTKLEWFAEVVTNNMNINNEKCMDEFEYMSLKLQETDKMYECCEPMIAEDSKEEDESLLKKRAARKGPAKRGRQRKDFQRDVLPGIVSLSRREVTEDLLTFEEAFSGIGVSWRSERKSGGDKSGRGRRRLAVVIPPSPPAVAAVEQSECRQVAVEEKSLSGWGKRTRRLPRQRCQNGGGGHHSLALKC